MFNFEDPVIEFWVKDLITSQLKLIKLNFNYHECSNFILIFKRDFSKYLMFGVIY